MIRYPSAMLVLMLVALAACQPAQNLAGIAWKQSYPLALEASIEGERPMLVYFSAEWCGICRALEAGALSDAQVQQATESYVAIRIDIDRQRRIAEKYQVAVVPTLLIVSPAQKVLRRSLGDQDVVTLLSFLQQ